VKYFLICRVRGFGGEYRDGPYTLAEALEQQTHLEKLAHVYDLRLELATEESVL
jgi:hypothetical protein